MTLTAETDAERVSRLFNKPESADKHDVEWLAIQVQAQAETIKSLKKQNGRFFGLREAAEMLEIGALKAHKVSFLYGKKQQTSMVQNVSLLRRMALMLRSYADDAEAGKLEAA